MERNRGAPEPASIDSYEKFSSILETESQTRLVVIDCHQDWCGPTTVMSAYW